MCLEEGEREVLQNVGLIGAVRLHLELLHILNEYLQCTTSFVLVSVTVLSFAMYFSSSAFVVRAFNTPGGLLASFC